MSASAKWPWSVLGLEGMPPETADVRRAYARALKRIDQSKDIDGFATLRAAYQEGLALRESRTARALARKERKAEAAAKAAVEPDSPASRDPTGKSDAPIAAEKAEQHDEVAKAEEKAFLEVIQLLATPNLLLSLEQRILAALDSRFMASPIRKAAIGYTTARLIYDGFAEQASDDPELDRGLSQQLIQKLDAEFGWISDYSAFRSNFGQNPSLQHEMLLRFHDGALPKAVPPVERKGPIRRILGGLASHPSANALIVVALFMVASGWSSAAPKNPTAAAFFRATLALATLLLASVGAYIVWNFFTRSYYRFAGSLLACLFCVAMLFLLPLYGTYQGYAFLLSIALFLVLLFLLFWIGPNVGKAKFEARLRSLMQRIALGRKG